MEIAEFDRFADEYYAMHRANIAITGETPDYFAAYKVKTLAAFLQSRRLPAGRILDFGAGIGNSIPFFRQFLPAASLTCADVSARSLALARRRFPGDELQLLVEAQKIPAPDAAFDVVFSACVFHHIAHQEHAIWLAELHRVTAPGGVIAVFEHNPLNPLTVRAVNTCPFDSNARLIPARRFASSFAQAGWVDPQIAYHVFFPRALAALRRFDAVLARLPLGAQYAIMAAKPGRDRN